MTARPDPAHRIDVLIADDDAEARWALRRLLEPRGYTVAEAEHGPGAVDLALASPPRCLLLDLAMPGQDGFGVARRLRLEPRTRGIHIHCLTGLGDLGARVRARLAGCEEFLTKPVDPARLLEVVGRHVGPHAEPPAAEWLTGWLPGLTVAEARDVLDWLENHGCAGLAVSGHDGRFAVRWVCPPGLRLGVEAGGGVRDPRS
jgi:CheY-like chemotaxis protein